MFIDTHAHLDFKEFSKDRYSVIKRAFEQGIEKIINVGTTLEGSKASIALAEKYANVFATVSLHPIDVDKEKFDEKIFEELAQHPKVVAIGETGFDFYHQSNRQRQKQVFLSLIKLAQQVKKPLIIHNREADKEILEVLSQSELRGKRGVVHCFSKDYNLARQFLDLGFLISYTGNITYDKGPASSIVKVPLGKIMVETDCPFMAPVPFRGKRNEPAYVKYVAAKIAEMKKEPLGKVAQATTKNAKDLFGLNV